MSNQLILNNQKDYQKYFKDTQDVYTKLQNYNLAYTNYVLCLENHPKFNTKGKHIKDLCMNYVYDGTTCTPPDSTQLMTEISKLQQDIGEIGTVSPQSNEELVEKYNEMLKLRKQLDIKLAELYQTKNSIPEIYRQNIDSTLYATFLWATLATCIIFYITTLK
jgi:hypothetical protein